MRNQEIFWIVKIANIEVILKNIWELHRNILCGENVYENLWIQMRIWFMNELLSFVACQKVKISCCITNNSYSGYSEESVGSSFCNMSKG